MLGSGSTLPTVEANRVSSALDGFLCHADCLADYMNGFRCKVTGATSDVALAAPQLPRRCGADPANGKMEAAPGNCTYGAKQPFYWFQTERNNVSVPCPLPLRS